MDGGAEIELGRAVAALARDLPRLNAGEADLRLARLRRQATHGGFAATAALAEAFGAAIARDRRAMPIGAWLDALTLATRCGDADAAPALLATIGVRLA